MRAETGIMLKFNSNEINSNEKERNKRDIAKRARNVGTTRLVNPSENVGIHELRKPHEPRTCTNQTFQTIWSLQKT